MTKAQIKFFQALGRQKYRKEYNAYLVEGYKNAKEWLLSGCRISHIAASAGWIADNRTLIAAHPEAELITAEGFELEKISALQTAQEVVLVARPEVSDSTPHRPAPGACCWKRYRTPAIWAPLSVPPTGLASSISFARMTALKYTIPKWYRQPWAAS